MKRMRILGLALVAVFALVAITAGAASAKPHVESLRQDRTEKHR